MRASTIVMIGFAVLFGLLAVFVAQSWLTNQTEARMRSLEAQKKPLTTRTIVVASRSLRFGNELNRLALREIPWPEEAVPTGAFAKIDDLLKNDRRVVLTSIESNEPILASKITGPGQRATLSSLLADGMRAVTIRVNDVDGVAGFVLPGDHVDVALTRQQEKGNATNDVVLQNVKVLAIDQSADERAEKPSVGRSATLEVETGDAQKLALAASIGTLSLVLRRAGETEKQNTQRVTAADLANPQRKQESRFINIGVTRASTREVISVPVEGPLSKAQALMSGETRVGHR